MQRALQGLLVIILATAAFGWSQQPSNNAPRRSIRSELDN
jgi:hypothetical protein